MPDIAQPNADIVFRQADIKFYEATKAFKPYTVESGLVGIVPMETLIEDQLWSARIPVGREWVGPRRVNSVSQHAKRLVARPYEDTIEMRMEDLKFEKLPLFTQNIETLAQQSEKLIDYQAAAYLLTNTHVGFDGQVLFSQSHPTSGGDVTVKLPSSVPSVQSNFDPTTPLTWDNYVAARAKMMSWLGEDGKPLSIEPDLLVVPPQLQGIAKNILEADMIANVTANIPAGGGVGQNIILAQNNTFKNTARLLIAPDLANMPQSWFLCDTKKAIKPLVWGNLESPIFTYLIDPKSPNVFWLRTYVYGWSRWGTLTESLWYLIYGATGGAAYGD